MFYSQKDLLEVISCASCHQVYTDPRLLPCTHTFCLRCLQEKFNENKLTCPVCQVEHSMSEDPSHLPPNMLAQKLVDLQPSQVYRGELVKELTEKLRQLEEKFDTQSNLVQNSPTMVREYCVTLREKVQSQAEKIKSKVDEFKAQFEEQIDLFESECVMRLSEAGASLADADSPSANTSFSVTSFNEMTSEFKKLSQEIRGYLGQCDLNKSELERMLETLNQYFAQIDDFGVKFQASIFKNTRLDFKPNLDTENLKPSFMGMFLFFKTVLLNDWTINTFKGQVYAITGSNNDSGTASNKSTSEDRQLDQTKTGLEDQASNEQSTMQYENTDESEISDTAKDSSFNIDMSKMRCFKLNKVCANYHSGFTMMRLDGSKFLLFYVNNENRLEAVKFDVHCNISYQNNNVLPQTRIFSMRLFKCQSSSIVIYAEQTDRLQSLSVLDLATLKVVKHIETETKFVNAACTNNRIYLLNKAFELSAYTLELEEVVLSKALTRIVPKTVVSMDAYNDLVYFTYYECRKDSGSYDLTYNLRIINVKTNQTLLEEGMTRYNQLKLSSSPWCLFTYSNKHKWLTVIKLAPVYDSDDDTIIVDEQESAPVPTSIKVENTKKYDLSFVKEADTTLVKDKLDGMIALFDRSTFKIYFSLC